MISISFLNLVFTLGLMPQSAALSMTCDQLLARPRSAERMARNYADVEHSIHRELTANLYDIQTQVSPEFADLWNEALIVALRKLPLPVRDSGRRASLNQEELRSLYWKVRNHPMSAVGSVHRRKYDPDRRFGFCFGRAFIAQMEALKAGLVKDSIRKVWIVGDMDAGGERWQHHVATMVRGEDGEWYVLDPLTREILTLPAWFELTKRRYPGVGVQLFATRAQRFSPSDERAMLPGTVHNPVFNRYFEDLLSYYRKESRERRGRKAGEAECARSSYSTWQCVKDVLGLP